MKIPTIKECQEMSVTELTELKMKLDNFTEKIKSIIRTKVYKPYGK